jgi:hypothetical protein
MNNALKKTFFTLASLFIVGTASGCAQKSVLNALETPEGERVVDVRNGKPLYTGYSTSGSAFHANDSYVNKDGGLITTDGMVDAKFTLSTSERSGVVQSTGIVGAGIEGSAAAFAAHRIAQGLEGSGDKSTQIIDNGNNVENKSNVGVKNDVTNQICNENHLHNEGCKRGNPRGQAPGRGWGLGSGR